MSNNRASSRLRNLKLFFACLLMAVLSIGQVWATDATMSGGTSVTVGGKSAMKVGASKSGGSMTITVGANATSLSFYIAAWSGDNTSVSVTPTANVGTTALSPTQDSGISGSGSSFTLNGTESTYYTTITLSNITAETAITLASSAGKNRFVVWGATYETSSGGSQQPTALDVPTGMSSGTPGMNSATLSWNAVTNASGYSLTIGTADPITSGFTTSEGVVSYNLTGLDAETTYTWKVKAVGDGTNYSSSADCASQNFTTAEDPTQKVLTFDLTSNPGGWPTDNSTTTTNYTYTLNTVNYSFALNNVKCNSGYLMMTAIAKLGLPAISNYKLVKVVASNSSGCSTATEVEISSDESGTAVTGGTKQTWSTTSSTYTYNLSGTEYNKMYYLRSVKSSKNTQITQLKLTYVPKPAVSGISIKTAPTKTTYTANENFDPSGLVITVTYTDETTEDVSYSNENASDFTFSPSTSDALNATNTSVTVTYASKTASQAITVNRIATTLAWSAASYTANIGASYTFPTLTKTPAALEGVTFSSSNTAVVETISSAGVPTVKGTGTTTITAAFTQTNVYAAATSASYTLTINEASSPSLAVNPATLTFPLTAVGGSSELTFDLDGEHLTADATLAISGTNAAMFSVAEKVEKDASDEIDETITVTYSPTAAAANHTATLTITSGVASATVTLSGSAKVKRTVTWYKADDTELTAQERGTAITEVWDGDAVTVLPNGTALSSCDQAISFQGWTNATYETSNDAPTVLFTDAEHAPTISGDNASYYAVWAKGGTKSDVLTRETTGVTNGSSTYEDWSGKTLTSTAVYAGSSAGGNDAIQLRSKNSNSGVITTASGGKASKVSVEWESNTAADRTLNVYGKNSAYSAPTDLFAETTQGTLLGTIVKGTSTELTISGDYAYIGVCSADGAIYLTSLTVQWSSISDYATTCSVPVEIADPTFSPAAGSYDNDQNVELGFASPATAVYYTTDGTSDPKTAGTAYTDAISVTADMTIKAAATDGNDHWSNVVTKTYTINYSSSIAAYIAKAQATTRYLRLNAAQNCVVTAVKKNNQDKVTNIYCQDNSGAGIILYNGGGFGDNEINVGDRIVGAVSGTWSPYLMQPEMASAAFADGVTFTAVGRPNAPTVTVANVNSGDAYTAHPMMLVTVENLYYKSVNGSAYTFNTQANGEGTDITIYDNFAYLSGKTMPGAACTIVGIMARNNNNYQVLPVELTTAATATLPTISPVGGASLDADEAEVEYLSSVSIPLVENEEIYVSVNDAEATRLTEAAYITIENDTKITVTAKREFYTDATVTYYYKPSAYAKNIEVTSAHGDVVVKVGDNEVTTALPGASVTFTVTPENEHFHIASTSVTYEGGSLTPSVNNNVYSFTMPDQDATIVVTYTEDTKYSITFNGGGAAGDGPAAMEDQYAGAEITLPTKEEANYTAPTDKVFNGWVVTSGEDEVEQNDGKFNMPAGNVTITAQWADRVACALTLNINGNTTTTNIDREVKYVLPTEVDDISGYTFYGWAEASEPDDVEEAIDTIKSFTPAANEASKTLYAVFKRTEESQTKTDVLTITDLGVTSSSYTEFTGKQKTSTAIYAGKVANNNSTNIQLKSKDSESGIVSTTSGGILKSVTITVANGSNTIDVYGSNTAYSAASDLYENNTKGTKIGSTSSTETITPTAQQVFNYVGVRSSSGAVYLSKVTITWTPKATYYTTAPAQVYDVSYNLGTNPDGAWKANEGCEAAKVKDGQTYSVCEDEPIRDHHKFNGWTVGGNAVSGTITITDNTVIVADWTAKTESTITYSDGAVNPATVVVSNVEEGTEVTLKAIGSELGQANFSKSGFDFKGWKYNGKIYAAGEKIEMPASDIEIVAQWRKQNVEKLTLVTNASQLVAGSKVVFANQTASAVAGESADDSNSFMASESATFNSDKSLITGIGNGIKMTLVQVADGWAFEYAGKYLKEYSGNKMCWVTNPIAWQVSINEDSARIERTVGNNSYAMRYNNANNSKRFAAYGLSGVKPIQLYAELVAVSSETPDTTDVSDLGNMDNEVIVVSGEGVVLNVNVANDSVSYVARNGATIQIATQNPTTKSVVADENSKIVVTKATTVNQTFSVSAKMGGGKSGQIAGSNYITIAQSTEAFFDITLGADGRADHWHAIAVPFPVDAINGVYDAETGAKLTNEVNYAIMSYHGDIRATGAYGWKKYRTIMQPGVFYLMTVDGNTKTFRFKMSGTTLPTATSLALELNAASGAGQSTDAGWNGVANPTLEHGTVNQIVTVLNPSTYTYEDKDAGEMNFVVGTPFFIQANATMVSEGMEMNAVVDGKPYYLPQRTTENGIENIKVFFGNDEYKDKLTISANENALNEYQIGKDLVKMTMTSTPTVAQIFGNAYNAKMCRIYAPLANNQAIYDIDLYVPAAGTYSLSSQAIEGATLYVTYNGAIVWNLSLGDYEIDLARGTTTGYGLLLVAQPNQMPTGVDTSEGVGGDAVQKILLNGQLYILRDGHLFDAVGKEVK